MKKTLFIFISYLFLQTSSFAQDGTLDPNFGQAGIATSFVDYGIQRVALQQDKFLTIGRYDLTNADASTIARYNYDGSIDTTFGENGYLYINLSDLTYLSDIHVFEDNSFMVCGSIGLADGSGDSAVIMKFNPDGSPFIAFGQNGIIYTANGGGTSMSVLPEGQIYAGGARWNNEDIDFAISCHTPDGLLDLSFGTGGLVTTTMSDQFEGIRSLKIDNNKRIVAGGAITHNPGNSDIAIARYNPDGSPDNTFGTNGKVITTITSSSFEEIYTIEILPGNKIIAAGQVDGNMALFQYNENGTPDLAYGENGVSIISFGQNILSKSFAMKLQEDYKPVVVGFSVNTIYNEFMDYNPSIIRLNTDGSLDNTFGIEGKIITPINNPVNNGTNDKFTCVTIQDNGAIVAGSQSGAGIGLVRYLSGESLGVIDFSANNNTSYVYPNPATPTSVIDYTLLYDEFVTIELLDLTGKKLKTLLHNAKQAAGNHTQELLLPSDLSKGTYLIVLSTQHGKATIKVIK